MKTVVVAQNKGGRRKDRRCRQRWISLGRRRIENSGRRSRYREPVQDHEKSPPRGTGQFVVPR